MKSAHVIVVSGLAALLLGLVVAGCENTSGASDVSGSWLYSDTKGYQSGWKLVQSNDNTVSGVGIAGEKISGGVSGISVFFNVTSPSNAPATLNGTVASNLMTGVFTNTTGTSGSWTAVRTN